MDSAAPAVSIVVPTHDRRSLLERKLRALEGEAQEGARADFEVIVVADGCSDDTERFLARYQPPYGFSWLTTPGRHAAFARNHGARVARGAVLLFSDDDVVPRPGWVAANLALHRAPMRVGLSREALPDHLGSGWTLKIVRGWWNVVSRSLSLPAELFWAVGGYDTAFSSYGGEDPDLALRLKAAGAVFELLPEVLVEHWDEGFLDNLEAKAGSAGAAHVRVWRKHPRRDVALALGVHPLSLALKRVLLSRAAKPFWDDAHYRYERAYADAARRALAEGAGPQR